MMIVLYLFFVVLINIWKGKIYVREFFFIFFFVGNKLDLIVMFFNEGMSNFIVKKVFI